MDRRGFLAAVPAAWVAAKAWWKGEAPQVAPEVAVPDPANEAWVGYSRPFVNGTQSDGSWQIVSGPGSITPEGWYTATAAGTTVLRHWPTTETITVTTVQPRGLSKKRKRR